MDTKKSTTTLLVTLLLTCNLCFADDWPQFRGPHRDGKSAETGLLKEWPQDGPGLLWSVEGLGIGFSSVAVANGFVYTTGMLDGGRVYMFSGTGVMACFNARSGREIWRVDTLKEFDGRNIRWGMSCSPLIDGDKVYCTPGGKKGTIVALDKTTGRTIWATTGLDEPSAYCSPILIERGGRRLLITMIQKSVICVSADDGRLIWREPYPAPSDTGTITPVYHDGCLYVTSVVNRGVTSAGTMFELSADGTSVKKNWNDQTLDCQHGGVILLDGYLYGSNWYDSVKGDWICLDWDTGQVVHKTTWNGSKGSIVYADKMFYCYDEDGNVGLVKASPKGFDVVSTFAVTQGSGKHWAHPAISDGRLYIRHGEALMAYDIMAE